MSGAPGPSELEQAARAAVESAAGAGSASASAALARLLQALSAGGPAGAYAELTGLVEELSQRLASVLADALLASGVAGRAGVVLRLPAATPPSPRGEIAPPPPARDPVLAAEMADRLRALPRSLRRAYLAAMDPALAAAVGGVLGAETGAVAEALGAWEDPSDVARLLPDPALRRGVAELTRRGLAAAGWLEAEAMAASGQAATEASRLAGLAAARAVEALAAASAAGAPRRASEALAAALPGGLLLTPREVARAVRASAAATHSAAVDAALADPVVGDAFPYEETLPIDDDRLSVLCEVVSRSGIAGTAVFRRDDPAWARLKPPRHSNCRCGRNPLTVEEAARRGVPEAREWQRSGRPPVAPAWVTVPPEAVRAGL